MDLPKPSAPKQEAPPKNAESRKNIPVICNSTRPEDGKKPQGIHLNPKFFRHPPEPQPRGGFPPCQPRFDHDFRMRFDGNPRPYRHEFHRGFPPPHPRFRPNFPPFPGPQHPFPQNRFPPPNSFGWNNGPRLPNYPYHPMEPPFQRNFPPNQADYNFHHLQHPPPQEFPPRFPLGPPPNFPRTDNMEPYAGPSYYDGPNDNFYEDLRNRRHHKSRSRSRSNDSGRHRSLSGSSSSYSNDCRPRRRSRSLSSRPHHSSPDTRSSHSSSEETIWDSDDERNSDSDLDLSKPLDSLTSDVSNSKTLLKHALKCLGSSKIQTMIPLELSQLNRKELFRMCAEILDETENDQLIKVMEGSISGKEKDEPCSTSTSSLRNQEYQSSNPDSDNGSVRRKISKKKRSKKKRKKKKRKTQQETESDEKSQESVDTDSASDSDKSEDKTSALDPALSTAKAGHCASTAQQSLLELIQIEYKTKAINVMLKNLGVATEISSLVSNVLQTNGISAVQSLVENQNTAKIDEKSMPSTDKIGASSESEEQEPPSDTREQDYEIRKNKDCSTPLEIDNEASGNVSLPEFDEDEGMSASDGTDEQVDVGLGITKEIRPLSSLKADDVPVDDTELLKAVDEDVLDLEVGANEKLEFLDV